MLASTATNVAPSPNLQNSADAPEAPPLLNKMSPCLRCDAVGATCTGERPSCKSCESDGLECVW